MDISLASLLPDSVGPLAAATLVATSLAASYVTAAFGLGGGLILIVALANLIPPLAVVPVHGVAQLGSNGGRALLMLKDVNRLPLVWFGAGSVIGAVAGGLVVVDLPGNVLRLLLGAFVLYAVWGPKPPAGWSSPPGVVIGGALSTILTMFVGATGPFVAAVLRPLNPGRHTFVASHAAAMVLQHGLKIIVFGTLGFAFGPWLPLLAAIVAAGFLGTVLGKRMLDRTTDARFGTILNWILTVLALRLVWEAARSLTGW